MAQLRRAEAARSSLCAPGRGDRHRGVPLWHRALWATCAAQASCHGSVYLTYGQLFFTSTQFDQTNCAHTPDPGARLLPRCGSCCDSFQRTTDGPPLPATAKAFSAVPVLLASAEITARPSPTPKPLGTGAPGSVPGSRAVLAPRRQGCSLQTCPADANQTASLEASFKGLLIRQQ